MKNRWSDAEARQYCDRYAPRWGEALALRVYTSRLIGAEADLVMHGGGNTSVKLARENLLGDRVDALCVKGSGWDLDSIEPEGFPALDLAWLRKLRKLEALSDEEMVNQLRTHLFDASAPNPSVETLLHAFLPHAFIDHTHDDLGLTPRSFDSFDDAAAEAAVSRLYGGIHYRPAIDLGLLQGRCIGAHVSALQLRG